MCSYESNETFGLAVWRIPVGPPAGPARLHQPRRQQYAYATVETGHRQPPRVTLHATELLAARIWQQANPQRAGR